MTKLYETAKNWATCSDEDVKLFKQELQKHLKYSDFQIACVCEWIRATYIDLYIRHEGINKDHLTIDKNDNFSIASEELEEGGLYHDSAKNLIDIEIPDLHKLSDSVSIFDINKLPINLV